MVVQSENVEILEVVIEENEELIELNEKTSLKYESYNGTVILGVTDLPKQLIPKRVGSSEVNDMTSNDLLGLNPDL